MSQSSHILTTSHNISLQLCPFLLVMSAIDSSLIIVSISLLFNIHMVMAPYCRTILLLLLGVIHVVLPFAPTTTTTTNMWAFRSSQTNNLIMRGMSRLLATAASASEEKVPITVLAGFLGAGKTTALKRLLENTDGIKVGTIVNDMASVNIDAKLISNPMNANDPDGSNPVTKGNAGATVELQNGCACCSLSDELLTSVSDLMAGRELDAIVVELSGVADPESVRQNWEAAVLAKHASTSIADLQRVVTVVDSHTFGSDWMSWDTAKKRSWAEPGDKCAEARQVPELLAEQVEGADVVILNKVDLSEGEQLIDTITYQGTVYCRQRIESLDNSTKLERDDVRCERCEMIGTFVVCHLNQKL